MNGTSKQIYLQKLDTTFLTHHVTCSMLHVHVKKYKRQDLLMITKSY